MSLFHKHFTLIALGMLLTVAGCRKETDNPDRPANARCFTATFADNGTRTVLNGRQVLWQKGDKINVFANGATCLYEETGILNEGRSAVFSGPAVSGADIYSFYPAREGASATGDRIKAYLPSVQNAVQGSFDPAANLMMAKADGNALAFRNVCGLVSVQVNNDDVTSIYIITEGESISGEASISWNDAMPEASPAEGKREEKAGISGDIANGVRYFIAAYPGTYDNPSIVITRRDGKTAVINHKGKLEVKRNGIVNTGALTIDGGQWKEYVFASVLRKTESTVSVAWTNGTAQIENYNTSWPLATKSYDPSADIADDYRVRLYRDEQCTDPISDYILAESKTSATATPVRLFTKDLPTRYCFTGLTPSTDYYLKISNTTRGTELSKPLKIRTDAPAFSGTAVVSDAKVNDVILFEDFRNVLMCGDMTTFSAGYSRWDRNKVTTLDAVRTQDGNFFNCKANVGIGLFNTLAPLLPAMGLDKWGWFAQDNTTGCLNICAGYIKIGANSKHAALVTPALSGIPTGYVADIKVSFKAAPYTGDATVDAREKDISVQLLGGASYNSSSHMVSDYNILKKHNLTLVDDSPDWREYSVGFEGVTPTGRIAFEGCGTSAQSRFNIDDIKVEITALTKLAVDGISASLIDATESTLSIGWTNGLSQIDKYTCNWPAKFTEYDSSNDISCAYKIELYRDSGCKDMIVGFNINTDNDIFTKSYPARFCFTGLEPETDYWFKVKNLNTGYTIDEALKVRTQAPVYDGPVVTSDAKAGDVILFEDFRKLVFCGDMPHFSTGYRVTDPTGITVLDQAVAKGDEPHDNINLLRIDKGIGLFNTLKALIPDMGLDGWAWFADGNTKGLVNCCAGHVKLGASSKHGAIATPVLSAIPSGYAARIRVSFDAAPYISGSTFDSNENDIRIDHIINSTSDSDRMLTIASMTSKNLTLTSKEPGWKTYSVEFEGVHNTGRISFYGNGASAQSRFYLDNIKIDVIGLEKDDCPIPASTSTIYGLVKCGGTPVKDVIVTDGYLTTKTDEQGFYELASKKTIGLVYLTTPSGYICPSAGVQPQFYKHVSKDLTSVQERVDFTLLDDGDQTNHEMLILGDIHHSNRSKDHQFETQTAEIRNYVQSNPGKKIYVTSLGDMINNDHFYTGYASDWFVTYINNELAGCKWYYTMGNHDTDFVTSVDGTSVGFDKVDLDVNHNFYRDYGPAYYSYNIGDVHYISLDSIVSKCIAGATTSGYSNHFYYREEIVPDVMNWLKKDLSYVSKSTPIVLLMHAPIWDSFGNIYNISESLKTPHSGESSRSSSREYALANGQALVNCFSGYSDVTEVSGHTHINWGGKHGNIREFNSGSSCGCFWWCGIYFPTLNLASDGGMGGYRVIRFEGPSIKENYYKCTGRPKEYQFRTYDRNTIKITKDLVKDYCNLTKNVSLFNQKVADHGDYGTSDSSNYVMINVWDWNDDWSISVTENGKALDVTHLNHGGTAKTLYDPLFVATYYSSYLQQSSDGATKTGQDADKSSHMFRVQASSATSTLVITVRDHLGHTYTETMKRPKAFTIENYK